MPLFLTAEPAHVVEAALADALDLVDFGNLRTRLSQNSVQEKLTKLWIDRCLRDLGVRDAAQAAVL